MRDRLCTSENQKFDQPFRDKTIYRRPEPAPACMAAAAAPAHPWAFWQAYIYRKWQIRWCLKVAIFPINSYPIPRSTDVFKIKLSLYSKPVVKRNSSPPQWFKHGCYVFFFFFKKIISTIIFYSFMKPYTVWIILFFNINILCIIWWQCGLGIY